jgi:hypothetical protein
MVAKGNRSAQDLVSALSANPHAGFFASSFWGPSSGENILLFERTGIEEKAEVLFWADPGDKKPLCQRIVFNIEFKTEPTDFAVLAKRQAA